MRRILFMIVVSVVALCAIGCGHRAPAGKATSLVASAASAAAELGSTGAAHSTVTAHHGEIRRLPASTTTRALVRETLRAETRAEALWDEDDSDDPDDNGGCPLFGDEDNGDETFELATSSTFPPARRFGVSLPLVSPPLDGLGPSSGHASTTERPPRV